MFVTCQVKQHIGIAIDIGIVVPIGGWIIAVFRHHAKLASVCITRIQRQVKVYRVLVGCAEVDTVYALVCISGVGTSRIHIEVFSVCGITRAQTDVGTITGPARDG